MFLFFAFFSPMSISSPTYSPSPLSQPWRSLPPVANSQYVSILRKPLIEDRFLFEVERNALNNKTRVNRSLWVGGSGFRDILHQSRYRGVYSYSFFSSHPPPLNILSWILFPLVYFKCVPGKQIKAKLFSLD